eukprot:TRINITY_DN6451_c0_g2_i2.p1 TRINITY_DN6451_c0_g2~~TRINITY_DN6451_c0_g2_i2.p1  ORF type:complete len:152 (+),score=5.33 TRINITY_DN6451_c0_g2_i2:520-975(+)
MGAWGENRRNRNKKKHKSPPIPFVSTHLKEEKESNLRRESCHIPYIPTELRVFAVFPVLMGSAIATPKRKEKRKKRDNKEITSGCLTCSFPTGKHSSLLFDATPFSFSFLYSKKRPSPDLTKHHQRFVMLRSIEEDENKEKTKEKKKRQNC